MVARQERIKKGRGEEGGGEEEKYVMGAEESMAIFYK